MGQTLPAASAPPVKNRRVAVVKAAHLSRAVFIHVMRRLLSGAEVDDFLDLFWAGREH
jgi:hypothetical protein